MPIDPNSIPFSSIEERSRYMTSRMLLNLADAYSANRDDRFIQGSFVATLEALMWMTGGEMDRTDENNITIMLAVAKQIVDMTHGFHGLN